MVAYQQEILQLARVGKEWRQSEVLMKNVSNVMKCVEDLGLYTTLEEEDMAALHKSKEFLYQSLFT